jgi:hypothetical protein
MQQPRTTAVAVTTSMLATTVGSVALATGKAECTVVSVVL